MRPFVASLLALIVVASAAEAQRPRRQGGAQGFRNLGNSSLLQLLTQKPVQEDLKLSEDQTTKVTQLAKEQGDKRREIFQDRGLSPEDPKAKMDELKKNEEKAITEALKPEQFKRLKQISLQRRGADAFADADVAAALKFTKEQQDQVKTIQDDARNEMRGLRGLRGQDRQNKIKEINESKKEKLMNVLTPEQKTTWKEMQGEPFKGGTR